MLLSEKGIFLHVNKGLTCYTKNQNMPRTRKTWLLVKKKCHIIEFKKYFGSNRNTYKDFAVTVIPYFIFEEAVKVFCNLGPRQYDLC